MSDWNKFYKRTPLPGWKKGISAAIVGGTNVSINLYSDEEKKKAAIEVVKFIISREELKKLVMENNILTGIMDLYDDEEVCSKIDCDLFKKVQMTTRYHYERKDYDDYASKIKGYFFEYLFGNKSVSEVLTKVNDITKIYTISLDTEDSNYGLIIFIITTLLSVLIVLSALFINMEKFKPFFQFLPKTFWYIIVLGILCYTGSNYTEYGEVLPYKYHLKIFLYCIGFTFIFIPLLYQVMVNFPDENKISMWISNHKYIFISIFLLIDVFLNLLNINSTYKVKTVTHGNGKMYQEYKITGSFTKFMLIFLIAIKILIILVILLLIFMEWNIQETLYDLRFSVAAIYGDLISVIMVVVLKYIKFNNYINYKIISEIFIIIFILSNYIFFIGVRVILPFFNGEKEDILKEITKFMTSSNHSTVNYTSKSSTTSKKTNSYFKIINYHYRTHLSDSVDKTSIKSSSVSNNISFTVSSQNQ